VNRDERNEINTQPGFFEFTAEEGLTKQIGRIVIAEALLVLCHTIIDSYSSGYALIDLNIRRSYER
jgi:hypothetical protein